MVGELRVLPPHSGVKCRRVQAQPRHGGLRVLPPHSGVKHGGLRVLPPIPGFCHWEFHLAIGRWSGGLMGR